MVLGCSRICESKQAGERESNESREVRKIYQNIGIES